MGEPCGIFRPLSAPLTVLDSEFPALWLNVCPTP